MKGTQAKFNVKHYYHKQMPSNYVPLHWLDGFFGRFNLVCVKAVLRVYLCLYLSE